MVALTKLIRMTQAVMKRSSFRSGNASPLVKIKGIDNAVANEIVP